MTPSGVMFLFLFFLADCACTVDLAAAQDAAAMKQ